MLTAFDIARIRSISGGNTGKELNALRNTMAETFTSEDGSEIEIENCVAPSRMLGLEIKGKTRVLKHTKDSTGGWTEILANEARDVETYNYVVKGTPGVISINDEEYAITSEELELQGIGNAKETLEIGGSNATHETKFLKTILSGNESWNKITSYGNVTRFDFAPAIETAQVQYAIVSDTVATGIIGTANTEAINMHTSANFVQLQIKSSKLNSISIDGLKAYLSQNPITICYQTATSTTENFTNNSISIADSENVFAIEGASEFSIKVAVDKISKLEQEIQTLQGN